MYDLCRITDARWAVYQTFRVAGTQLSNFTPQHTNHFL